MERPKPSTQEGKSISTWERLEEFCPGACPAVHSDTVRGRSDRVAGADKVGAAGGRRCGTWVSEWLWQTPTPAMKEGRKSLISLVVAMPRIMMANADQRDHDRTPAASARAERAVCQSGAAAVQETDQGGGCAVAATLPAWVSAGRF